MLVLSPTAAEPLMLSAPQDTRRPLVVLSLPQNGANALQPLSSGRAPPFTWVPVETRWRSP